MQRIDSKKLGIYLLVAFGLLAALWLIPNYDFKVAINYIAMGGMTLVFLAIFGNVARVRVRVTIGSILSGVGLGLFFIILVSTTSLSLNIPDFQSISGVGETVTVTIVAPLLEESFFKFGLLLPLMAFGLPLLAAALIGLILFPFWHFATYEANTGSMIGAGLFYLASFVVFWLTKRNLVPVVIGHFLINAFIKIRLAVIS